MSGPTQTQRAGPIGLDNSMPVAPADGNLAFVLQKVNDVVFEQRQVVPPAPNQVQVNIRQVSGVGGRQRRGAVCGWLLLPLCCC